MNDKAKLAEKPKRISKKVKTAIDALISGDAKTITDAAKIAGLSREHLSREFGRPHVNNLLRGKALKNVAMAAARASAVKVELLDCENAMVRDRASSFILGASGISGNDDGIAKPGTSAPGLTIVVMPRPLPNSQVAPQSIDVTPLPLLPVHRDHPSES